MAKSPTKFLPDGTGYYTDESGSVKLVGSSPGQQAVINAYEAKRDPTYKPTSKPWYASESWSPSTAQNFWDSAWGAERTLARISRGRGFIRIRLQRNARPKA